MKIEDLKSKKLADAIKKYELNIDDYETEEALDTAVADLVKAEKDNKNEDVDFWKDEAKKAFEARDAAKKDKLSLQQKIKDLEDKLSDAPNASELKTLKTEIKALKEFKAQIDTEREEEELKNKTDIEKTKISFEKEFKTFKEEMEDKLTTTQKKLEEKDTTILNKDKEIVNLRKFRLQNEILEVATKMKAYRPNQVVKLLTEEFEYDSSLDNFSKFVKDSKGKITDLLSVGDVVKGFLEDPDNDNLVEADVKPGTGHNDNNRNVKEKKKDEKSTYDPEDEDLKLAADEHGMTVENWIEVKEKRDARLQQRKAA